MNIIYTTWTRLPAGQHSWAQSSGDFS